MAIPLLQLLKGQTAPPEPILAQAHFWEHQMVHPKLGWAEAAALLPKLFPREARPERPAAWYRRIRATHWPAGGEGPDSAAPVLPGNGPFYLRDADLPKESEEARKEREQVLTKAGFKKVVAHVAYLGMPGGEWLDRAMRKALKDGDLAIPFNVDPLVLEVYLYPSLGRRGVKDLRDYNVVPATAPRA